MILHLGGTCYGRAANLLWISRERDRVQYGFSGNTLTVTFSDEATAEQKHQEILAAMGWKEETATPPQEPTP